jgi:hypothetical protein
VHLVTPDSVVAPKRRRTRANPHSPLATPVPDPEKIIKKGKDLQGASSSKSSGTTGNLPDSVFHTLVVISKSVHLPEVQTPVKVQLEGHPLEHTHLSPDLKEKSLESFDFLASPEVVKWFRLESLEYFPALGSPNTNLLKSIKTKEKGTSFPEKTSTETSKTGPIPVKSESSKVLKESIFSEIIFPLPRLEEESFETSEIPLLVESEKEFVFEKVEKGLEWVEWESPFLDVLSVDWPKIFQAETKKLCPLLKLQ